MTATEVRALFTVGLALFAACGEGGPGPIGTVMDVEVLAGEFVEADFTAAEGDVIVADFDAGGIALRWNVHTHRDGQEERYRFGTSAADVIEFTSPESFRYSFYWENLTSLNATMQVSFQIGENTTFEGWLP